MMSEVRIPSVNLVICVKLKEFRNGFKCVQKIITWKNKYKVWFYNFFITNIIKN